MLETDLNTRGNRVFWAMYNNQLIIFPKASAGADVELTGFLSPPYYTDADLYMEMVKVPDPGEDEVQSLSDTQLKLVRYRVMQRLMEDLRDFEGAAYMKNEVRSIEHELRKTHDDEGYSDSVGIIRTVNNG